MKKLFDVDEFSSFSSVVSALQGDLIVGKESLIELSEMYFDAEKTHKKAMEEAIRTQGELEGLRHNIGYILKHLNLEVPLTIVSENKVIQIQDSTVIEIKNVI